MTNKKAILRLEIGGHSMKEYEIDFEYKRPTLLDFEMREMAIKKAVLRSQIENHELIHDRTYEMHLCVMSKANPSEITDFDYNNFLFTLAKKRQFK